MFCMVCVPGFPSLCAVLTPGGWNQEARPPGGKGGETRDQRGDSCLTCSSSTAGVQTHGRTRPLAERAFLGAAAPDTPRSRAPDRPPPGLGICPLGPPALPWDSLVSQGGRGLGPAAQVLTPALHAQSVSLSRVLHPLSLSLPICDTGVMQLPV